jgi:hypothetical protein
MAPKKLKNYVNKYKVRIKIMQYSILLKNIKINKDTYHIPKDVFLDILQAALRSSVNFDEKYYLNKYPDVLNAIKSKKIDSAEDHYVNTGYFESRLPYKIMVDEKYYFSQNPDVERAVKSGQVSSAQDHFENTGYLEGRVPFQGFSLIPRDR